MRRSSVGRLSWKLPHSTPLYIIIKIYQRQYSITEWGLYYLIVLALRLNDQPYDSSTGRYCPAGKLVQYVCSFSLHQGLVSAGLA